MQKFTQATREKAKLRLALTGVSGAGKTLSALYLAFGMTGDWSKIAFIDTEHGRGKFYAEREDLPFSTGRYLYADMQPPFSPDKYVEYVAEAAEAVGGDGVVIVDSFSHAWNSEGGVLEIKDSIAARAGQNSYTAWGEAGRMQNHLINTLLSADCHIIVTMRAKMEYALQENQRGKMEPVKLGLAPVQRDDAEYEFDIVLHLARDHTAQASKDITFLDQYVGQITPELGKQLKAWLDQGISPPRCAACHDLIRPTASKTAAEILEGTQRLTGEILCAACCKKWVKDHTPEPSGDHSEETMAGVSP